MNELSLFTGAGGGLYGSGLLGWRTLCAVEIDLFCRCVLLARQNDGTFPPFFLWDDIRTFDGTRYRGAIDVISGGFPCQDISAAGKGLGIYGARSGLWFEMARIIGEVRPRYVLVENSPELRRRGLDVVIGNLSALGYASRWTIVGAHQVGAHHKRDRLWILAHTNSIGWGSDSEFIKDQSSNANHPSNSGLARSPLADSNSNGRRRILRKTRHRSEESQFGANSHGKSAREIGHGPACGDLPNSKGTGQLLSENSNSEHTQASSQRKSKARRIHRSTTWPWPVEPDVGRVAHGVANRSNKLKALGNGQVPRVVAVAWALLGGPINES